ncbi:uncharacterized protein LOC127900922 [Citrus sinensis]|uniref:uncharacterized protein LOC127900922 n=1 Tax=Citrus sinensis TaxID=2711 RepID=UPI002279690A|nr:uncharacterized protein LOC127900922 [Citrus sinensis]
MMLLLLTISKTRIHSSWRKSVTWKKKVDISYKLSAKVKKRLLDVEDWKFLLTPERLLSTSLICSLPHNSKKKKTKRTKENISTAKHTPAKIAKALIEEISNEEGELHSKKPQRAS